jgi:1-acyl-sn-glycerol-3-phosphate acyltransferase
MKVLISLYAWVFGGLYFVVLCLITIVLTFFLKPKTVDRWIKINLRFLFKMLFIKVHSEGSENIDPEKTYLFMSNHSSLFDIPLLEAYIPTFVRGVEALRQFKWPVYGWVIKRLGNIPIDRKNIHASIRSMKTTERSLKGGLSIVILPEGHRTLDGNLGEFKRLPFHLAKQAEVSIIPIGISGLFELKRKGSWHIRPCPVSIKFGEAVGMEEIEALSVDELRDKIREKICALIS